ncbi:LPXTG cell wall anchor domain-containing protein [Microbacterium sp.]|uniref:DUF7507 domain-containing protein n=1 Tax=Microbacterium sp. TaxID=51671 RepID=UPI002735EF63|nr:LPXTG cell wall anchor domain-containing protein [Microbacterium sp.]MDP3952576.1 LPXTG cell wall anchor domain-containing protein [Microbacterium sp.]
MLKANRTGRRSRSVLAGVTSLLVALATVLVAAPASAATVYEITGRWADGTVTEAKSGDVVNAEWRVNVNDDAPAPGNEPVDNVTFEVTLQNGVFGSLPTLCLTADVDPASSISADGATLTCNVGTANQGTAVAIQTPIEVDGPTGSQLSASGTIDGQTVDLSPIDIVNEFGMDIRWGTGTSNFARGADHYEMDLQWTLSKLRGSEAGPQTVTYDLNIASVQGSAIQIAPQQCASFNALAANGHPWSGGDHPAAQMTSFVDDCQFVQTGPNTFRLTLTGIDYEPANPPTLDSAGGRLPVDEVALASGSIWIRVMTDAPGSVELTSNAPTYTSPTGATAQDAAANNTESKAWTTIGLYSSGWGRGFTGSGGTTWDNTYQVSAGTQVSLYMHTLYQLHSYRADDLPVGMCSALDTRYVTFDSFWYQVPAGGVPGSVVEYYTGDDVHLDPASGGYDPYNFDCGVAGGWSTALPADLTDVKAVRYTMTQGQAEAVADENVLPRVVVDIKPDTPAGTDVWSFMTVQFDSPQWFPRNECITPIPGGRYPCTTGFADVLHVVSATPAVMKSVDRTVVSPGAPATYTLTYSANGAGSIPATVDGYQLVDTLPAGSSYVAGSATPEPTVSTDGAGQQVLTWVIDGVATNADHALTYQAVTDDSVTPGQTLTNTVTASYGGNTKSAAAQVTAATNGYTEIGKSADTPFIPNLSGDGDGDGSWTVTLRSFDPSPQSFTDTIDILPYNGDDRGTEFAGSYALDSVEAAPGATIYYAIADPATLSDDPNDAANGAAGAPSGLWSTTFSAEATAIRVVGPQLAAGATQQFTVNFTTDGVEGGDVLVNRAQAIAEHTELVMRTSAPITVANYYSAALKKYVQDAEGNWRDANDVTDYPTFQVGDTIRYKIEVENTGQGTLTNIAVTDDKQPELGSFEIGELAPGAVESHEFEIVVDSAMGDSVVNTACASADIPVDSGVAATINCDPAGFEVDGDPSHEKSLISATPIGGGQWQLVYGIEVTNASTASTSYSLADTLHFTDEATIVSAGVTSSPAGVALADPAWDGQGNLPIAADVLLAGNDDAGYAPHHYEVTVVADVPLHLDGAGGAPDATECPAEGSEEDQGFNNTSELTDAAGEIEEDQACAPIPSIDITKSVSAGPVPNGDGTWTVTYDIVATNTGAFEGVYDVTDRMIADGDMEVVSGSVSSAPDGVTASPAWTGLGLEGATENIIATNVTLLAGVAHTYQVEVVIGIAAGVGGAPVITPCSADPGAHGGLSNAAGIEHNDLTDQAEACVAIGFITVDKSVASGPTPNGDGTWTVAYDIVAENIGAAAGEYDVFDRLHFGDGIEIADAAITDAPDGVSTNADWTGLSADERGAENLVASDVALAAAGVHTYRVEVTVQMDEADIDPSALVCPAPGTGDAGGLANSASVDHNGIIAEDEVCPTLPLITIDKSVSTGPTPNGDGTWTITYDLTASNTGAAAGDYDIADQLRYGDGIVIESAGVVAAPAGVSTNAGWTGEGDAIDSAENEIASDVTIDANGVHTYQVQVVVSLDRDTVTPGSLVCPAPGSDESGGLANTTELTHNGESQDDDACASLPLIDIAKSLSGAVAPVDGQDGVYDATYEITVINSGSGAGAYDLDDTLAPGEGVEIVGIQGVTTDASAPVGINTGFDGLDDVRIVTAQPIEAAPAGSTTVHTYTVTVRYSADLSDVTVPDTDACTTEDGTVAGGLNNIAAAIWNGIEDEDDACVRPGKPTLDKALVSATPAGDGTWEVVYDLTVGNVGAEATTYDLDDEFLFAPVITVESVTVNGPDGVAIDGSFDGENNQRIATDVSIPGLDDEEYAPHVYRVTAITNVPLAFEAPAVDGTGSPACTAPSGGNFTEQGLNNAATLTDETGGQVSDTDCAGLPSIDIEKSVVGEPVKGSDGAWTVTYEIVASNTGAAAGDYTLTDRLRYGAGITVTAATVTQAPDGVALAAAWTGQGAEGADENIVATGALDVGGVHTYRVVVQATLDTKAADGTTLTCPAPGSDQPGGFANTAGVAHNDLTGSADACATPEWPAEVPLPQTGGEISLGLLSAAMLLLLAGGVLLYTRRRRAVVSE